MAKAWSKLRQAAADRAAQCEADDRQRAKARIVAAGLNPIGDNDKQEDSVSLPSYGELAEKMQAEQVELDAEKVAAVADLVRVTQEDFGTPIQGRRQRIAVNAVLHHLLGRPPREEEIMVANDLA